MSYYDDEEDIVDAVMGEGDDEEDIVGAVVEKEEESTSKLSTIKLVNFGVP